MTIEKFTKADKCPFCDTNDKLFIETEFPVVIRCETCGIRFGWFIDAKEARKMWAKRPHEHKCSLTVFEVKTDEKEKPKKKPVKKPSKKSAKLKKAA